MNHDTRHQVEQRSAIKYNISRLEAFNAVFPVYFTQAEGTSWQAGSTRSTAQHNPSHLVSYGNASPHAGPAIFFSSSPRFSCF
ncbi:Uncharacterized protein HZ326_7810 [Fusarium oxysporum f. sp. albedinis]|nr:Uncharacterized protein HZ326_7810 [Fusarium oxysporum f. sp. albedinis]